MKKISLHSTVRFLYLLVSSATLPLALLFLRFDSPEYFSRLPGVFFFLIPVGCIFWAIFFIVFEQRYFPGENRRALLDLFALLANALTAVNIAGFNIFYGAYSVMISTIFSQFFYFMIMLVLYHSAKKEKYFYYLNAQTLGLLIFAFLLMGLLVYVFYPPLLKEFLGEENIIWQGIYLASFSFHVFWDTKNLLQNNMFQYDTDGKRLERDVKLGDWALSLVLLILLSVMASILILSGVIF